MKKLILTLAVIVISVSIYAQELSQDTSKKEFRNIIGLDITGLLSQIRNYYPIDYNQYPYYNYYSSSYIITYKRIYKNNALRIGIGGGISNGHSTNNDTSNSKSKSNNFTLGLGYEHYGYIAKKWTFYYGIDAIGYYYDYNYQYDYSHSYNRKETSQSFSVGAAPLFGLILRFNKRISIATETSYDIMYNQTKSDYIYYNSPGNNSHSKSSGLQTQYYAPSTIIIRIQF